VGRISRTLAAIVQKGQGQPVLVWRGEVPASQAHESPADEDF
jgi:hypothetical protein